MTSSSVVALQTVNGIATQEGAVYRIFRPEAGTVAPEPVSDFVGFTGAALLVCLESWSTQEWSAVIRFRLQASTSKLRRLFTFKNTLNVNEYAYLHIEPFAITWGWRPAGASSDVTMRSFASAVPAVDAWTVLSVKVGFASILMYKDGALLTSTSNPFSSLKNDWNRLEVGGDLDGDISHIALFDRSISGGGKATVNGPSSLLMLKVDPPPAPITTVDVHYGHLCTISVLDFDIVDTFGGDQVAAISFEVQASRTHACKELQIRIAYDPNVAPVTTIREAWKQLTGHAIWLDGGPNVQNPAQGQTATLQDIKDFVQKETDKVDANLTLDVI